MAALSATSVDANAYASGAGFGADGHSTANAFVGHNGDGLTQTQIGSAPYAVTKHAAVAFAEWLSVTYGDRGVRVSCLCPMGVNTAMLQAGMALEGEEGMSTRVVAATGDVLEPEEVASTVVDALREERFLVLPHPEVLEFLRRKTSDYDRWLAGMRRLQAAVAAA